MAINYNEVRQLALALPGITEGRAYGGPSLHVGRKFLGRLLEDNETFVLKVDPTTRVRLLEDSSDTFFLTDHYLDHPLVLVNLLAAERKTLAKLIEQAWRSLTTKRVVSAYDALSAANQIEQYT